METLPKQVTILFLATIRVTGLPALNMTGGGMETGCGRTFGAVGDAVMLCVSWGFVTSLPPRLGGEKGSRISPLNNQLAVLFLTTCY